MFSDRLPESAGLTAVGLKTGGRFCSASRVIGGLDKGISDKFAPTFALCVPHFVFFPWSHLQLLQATKILELLLLS
jgi:hypothetical protein